MIRPYFTSGHVARLDSGVPAHDPLRLVVVTYTKVESQWPAGEDRRVALTASGSTSFRSMPTLYCYLRCGDPSSPGVTLRRNGPLGLRDDDDDDISPSDNTFTVDTYKNRAAGRLIFLIVD